MHYNELFYIEQLILGSEDAADNLA